MKGYIKKSELISKLESEKHTKSLYLDVHRAANQTIDRIIDIINKWDK